MIEQAFKKQIKAKEDSNSRSFKTSEKATKTEIDWSSFPGRFISETKNEIDKIKKLEEQVNMILENFEQLDLMMRVFLTVFLKEAHKKQGGFSNVLSIFNDKVTPRPKADKDEKKAIQYERNGFLWRPRI